MTDNFSSVQSTSTPVSYKRSLVENMLKLFSMHDPSYEHAYVVARVNSGYMSNSMDQRGIYELAAYSMFYGSKNFHDDNEFASHSTANGILRETEITGSASTFFFSCPSNKLADSLIKFLDSFASPLFDKYAVKNGLKDMEYLSEKNKDASIGRFLSALETVVPYFRRPSYQDLSYRVENDFENLKEDLISIWKKYYNMNNINLFIVSNNKNEDVLNIIKSVKFDSVLPAEINPPKYFEFEPEICSQMVQYYSGSPFKKLSLVFSIKKRAGMESLRAVEHVVYEIESTLKKSLEDEKSTTFCIDNVCSSIKHKGLNLIVCFDFFLTNTHPCDYSKIVSFFFNHLNRINFRQGDIPIESVNDRVSNCKKLDNSFYAEVMNDFFDYLAYSPNADISSFLSYSGIIKEKDILEVQKELFDYSKCLVFLGNNEQLSEKDDIKPSLLFTSKPKLEILSSKISMLDINANLGEIKPILYTDDVKGGITDGSAIVCNSKYYRLVYLKRKSTENAKIEIRLKFIPHKKVIASSLVFYLSAFDEFISRKKNKFDKKGINFSCEIFDIDLKLTFSGSEDSILETIESFFTFVKKFSPLSVEKGKLALIQRVQENLSQSPLHTYIHDLPFYYNLNCDLKGFMEVITYLKPNEVKYPDLFFSNITYFGNTPFRKVNEFIDTLKNVLPEPRTNYNRFISTLDLYSSLKKSECTRVYNIADLLKKLRLDTKFKRYDPSLVKFLIYMIFKEVLATAINQDYTTSDESPIAVSSHIFFKDRLPLLYISALFENEMNRDEAKNEFNLFINSLCAEVIKVTDSEVQSMIKAHIHSLSYGSIKEEDILEEYSILSPYNDCFIEDLKSSLINILRDLNREDILSFNFIDTVFETTF